MSNEAPQQPAFAVDSAPRQETKAAAQVNPASAEAQELQETGMHPVAVGEKAESEKKAVEGAPKKETEEKGTQTSENPQEAELENIKSSDQAGSGEEAAGWTQLAAERARADAAKAKETAVGAAATAGTATKETARKVYIAVISSKKQSREWQV